MPGNIAESNETLWQTMWNVLNSAQPQTAAEVNNIIAEQFPVQGWGTSGGAGNPDPFPVDAELSATGTVTPGFVHTIEYVSEETPTQFTGFQTVPPSQAADTSLAPQPVQYYVAGQHLPSKRPKHKLHDPKKDLWWKKWAIDVCHTGSRVICDPAPKDTDDDWLILVAPESVVGLEKKLKEEGFKKGGSVTRQNDFLEEFPKPIESLTSDKGRFFHSWKKDDFNVVVTISPEYFSNFSKATDLACRLNLLDKRDRIAVFDAVVYDIWP